MQTLTVEGLTHTSTILVGEQLANLANYLPATQTILITDENVRAHYGAGFPAMPVICIGTGEKHKTLTTVDEIMGALVKLEADRSAFIVGIGGGLVCDVTGFVASIYLRGVRFGFVSTTLLSQVDASVGGKNGVNYGGYKNMVGVFNQPEFVICDPAMLRTLPEKEYLSGMAEVIKHAAIEDADLFAFLEANVDRALALAPDVVQRAVYDSVVIKSQIVNRDEREKGERRKLNFGHTFGHAIEKTTGMAHGEAVSIGMAIAANLSVRRGLLAPEQARRLIALIEAMKLPVRLDGDNQALIDALGKDKKRQGDQVHFVLLEDIGRSVITPIALEELKDMVADI